MEGWQSGQMQRTVNPSTSVYESSNLSPSTMFTNDGLDAKTIFARV